MAVVPLMKVERPHVRGRPLAAPLLEPRLDAGVLAGAVAVAPVEDQALVEDDRLEEPVLLEVADELAELRALDLQQREEGGGWVVVEGGGGDADGGQRRGGA
jgi:hypothetical protein